MKCVSILLICVIGCSLVSFVWSQNEEIDDELREETGLLDKVKGYYNAGFGVVEKYTVELQMILKNKFNIGYPYDMIAFFVIGIIVKVICRCVFSCKKKKDTYVYNTSDIAEPLYAVLNKVNNLTQCISAMDIGNQNEQKQGQEEQAEIDLSNVQNEIESKIQKVNQSLNQQFNDISNIIQSVTQKCETNRTNNIEFLRSVEETQRALINDDDNNNDEGTPQ